MYINNCYIFLINFPPHNYTLFVFVFKSVLLNMRMATHPFWPSFANSSIFCPFTLNLCLSVELMWVAWRQHVVESYFLIHPTTPCFLICEFNSFTFKVIIDRWRLNTIILFSGCSVSPLFFFLLVFLSAILNWWFSLMFFSVSSFLFFVFLFQIYVLLLPWCLCKLLIDKIVLLFLVGLPRWFSGKESTHNVWDTGSIPESGRSPGEENGNPSSILAWRIPWTEEPGRLQSTSLQSQTRLSTHMLITSLHGFHLFLPLLCFCFLKLSIFMLWVIKLK